MTTTLKDTGTLGQSQGPTGTGSGLLIPTDVELRAQALEYALRHTSGGANVAQDAIKAAEVYYQFLRQGLDQTISAMTNGQQTNRYPGGQTAQTR